MKGLIKIMKADKKTKEMLLEVWNIYKDNWETIQDWYGYLKEMINKLRELLDYLGVDYE